MADDFINQNLRPLIDFAEYTQLQAQKEMFVKQRILTQSVFMDEMGIHVVLTHFHKEDQQALILLNQRIEELFLKMFPESERELIKWAKAEANKMKTDLPVICIPETGRNTSAFLTSEDMDADFEFRTMGMRIDRVVYFYRPTPEHDWIFKSID